MHRADRRQVDAAVLAPDLLPDLRRTPAGPLLLEPQDQRFKLERQLIGLPIGSSGPVFQPLQPAILVSLEDLVAGLPRYAEVPADHGHLLAFHHPGHKPQTLVHLGTLLPWHLCSPAQGAKSVTYVSGITCYL